MNQKPNKISVFVVIFIFIGFIIIAMGCNDENSSKSISSNSIRNSTNVTDTSAATSTPITTIHRPRIKFQIILKENDSYGYINKLMVYTKSMDSLKSLNEYLLSKYKSAHAVTFQIYYFDNKKIAKNYGDILHDENTSDDEVERVSQHIIGKYEYNQYVGEEDGLKIGRDPEMN